MKIEFPNGHLLSADEQADLIKLKTAIETAIADGLFTQAERDRILAIMRADHRISFEELELIRTEIRERIDRGELRVDFS